MTASDCDGANFNSLLQYDIIGGNTNQTFDISETGEIAVASSPDREVTSLYEVSLIHITHTYCSFRLKREHKYTQIYIGSRYTNHLQSYKTK